MSKYLCDTCSREFPGGLPGSSFLVKPNGYTAHLCSASCLRTHVINAPIVPSFIPVRILAIAFLAGVIVSAIFQRVFH